MDVISTISFIAFYGISYGMVLFTISIGLVVTMGLMRVLNMAHGVFAALGGYVALTLMSQLHVNFWIAVPTSIAIAVILGVLTERIFFVRLYAAPNLDQVLLTIGLAFIGVAFFNLLFGPNPVPSSLPPVLAGNVDIGVLSFQVYRVFVVVLGAMLMLALWYVFEATKLGAELRAAVDNRGMAEAVGINVRHLFSITFALGCGLAALGGAIGYVMLPLEPLYPFKYLNIILIVVALSGFGNIKRASVTAIMVGVVDTAGRLLLPSLGAFIVYFFLIGMMVWRNRETLA
jgi:branched-chain amino acid transport system permease protein